MYPPYTHCVALQFSDVKFVEVMQKIDEMYRHDAKVAYTKPLSCENNGKITWESQVMLQHDVNYVAKDAIVFGDYRLFYVL